MTDMRPIRDIAADIKRLYIDAGKPVYYAAAPYLEAALTLNTCKDKYILDTGSSVVAYLLANLHTLRGPAARMLKRELKAHLEAA